MVPLIDVNCRIGRGPADREDGVKNNAELLSLMDRFHVKKAAVYHSAALYSDAELGNRLLTEETQDNARFAPQWAVQPALWESFQTYRLLSDMKTNDVRSVRCFPKQYGHSLKRYACEQLLDALSECRVPVFIGLDQLSSWDALYELCADYPRNRFVLCAPGYRCLRYLIPILESCPNLSAETSNLLIHDGLTCFCRHGLGGRLLFGSGIPESSLAAAASQLLLSDLSDAEKRRIASDNAEELFAEVSL